MHMSKEHGEIKLMRDQIECKSCEMKFPFPNFYIQHHQNVHGNLPPDYDDKGNLLQGVDNKTVLRQGI